MVDITGNYFQKLKKSGGEYGCYRYTTQETCEITIVSRDVVFVFANCQSLIEEVDSGRQLSIFNVLVIPARKKIRLRTISRFSELSVISIRENLLHSSLDKYELDRKRAIEIYKSKSSVIVARNNWLNEVYSRIIFSLSEDSDLVGHDAITFLVPEMIKEVYYSQVNKFSFQIKTRLNLSTISFEKRSPEILKTINYIEQNLFASLTNDLIAKNCGFSSRALQKIFKLSIGLTLSQYITHRKMEEAHILLRSKKLSVKETSFAVGYNSCSSFIKAFKKIYQVSPDQAREDS